MKNELRNFTKKHSMLVLTVLLITAICLHYCCQKSGFFIDELYSYGLSNGQNTPFVSYIHGEVCGQTYTGQEFYDYLTVSNQDAFDYASVYYNQTQDVHPPLFYFLMHTVSSVFQNSYSKWIGIGLNIPIFILTNVLLYIVLRKLFGSSTVALCGVILYGLNTMAISTFLMIRMYMLLTCLTILLPYTLIRLNEKQTWYHYVFVGLTIFSGLFTQYYYVFYAFFVCGSYCLWLLWKKQFKKSLMFAISALCGVAAFYLVFPHCIDQLLGDSIVAGASVVSNAKNVAGYLSRIITFGGVTAYYSVPAVFVAAGALILCLRNIKGLKAVYKEKTFNFEALIYIIPAALTFLVVSIIAPVIAVRYIYNILPTFILAVCFLLNLAKHSLRTKNVNRTAITAGMLAIAVAFALLIQPTWLYTDHKDHEKEIEPFTNQPCIYIAENRNGSITADVDVLSKFDRVYVSLPTDTNAIEDYIDSFDNYANIIVYISSTVENLDHDVLLTELCQQYELDSYEVLHQRSRSTAYVLLCE